MASITIQGGDRFPDGTLVSVYATPALPLGSGAPSGSVVTTGTFSSGTVTFSGLADSTNYVAYAQVGGADRYKRFRTDTPAIGFDGATAGEIEVWDASLGRPVARDADFLNGVNPPFNIKGDAVKLTDVAVAAGTNVVTSASAAFTPSDVGKAIRVVQQAFTITGTTTSGSTSITSVSGWPAGLTAQNGMAISGTGLRAGSTINAGAGTATITLPGVGSGMAATASGSGVTLTVTGFVAISGTITGYTDAHTVTVSATWAGSTGLSGCVAEYGTDNSAGLLSLFSVASGSARYLPNGRYLTTSIVDVPAGFSNLHIQGGTSTRIVVAPGVNNVGVQFNQSGNDLNATTRGSRLVLRDLRIEGYGYAQRGPGGSATAATLSVIGCDRVRLDNVEVVNARDQAFNIRGCTHTLLTGCRSDTVTFGNAGNSFNVGGATNYGASDLAVLGCEAFNVADIGFDIGIGAGKRTLVQSCITVGGNSGIHAEGVSTADSGINITIAGCIAKDCVNIGIGASSTAALREHVSFVISGNQAINCAIAIEYVGQNGTITGNVVEGYTSTGIWLGGGEFDEYGTTISGNVVSAAATGSPGNAINLVKSGALTNYLRGVSIVGNRLDGGTSSTGGQRGVSLAGKIKNVGIVANTIASFRNSGVVLIASNGASPVDTRIIGNDIRNNNQAANGAGVNSVGIACEASADSVIIEANRVTDDQGSPTQTHALHWLSATRGRIRHNDFRGNLTSAKSVTFDSLTVYADNIEVDDAYEGLATLVGGTITVSNTAVKSDSLIEAWHQAPNGTPGGLRIQARTNGTSFQIQSSSGTDTSVVKWRIH